LNESQFDLKAELKAVGMNLTDFANIVDLSPNTVSRWVRGEINTPKWVRLFVINYQKAKLFDDLALQALKFQQFV
jgi:transcriptional regulator with XRE-family HTH domain